MTSAIPPETKATWSALFARPHRGVAIVLAGGVAVYATNVYLTTTLLPSAVREIGGEQYFALAMSGFLIASVITSMFVRRAIDRLGPFGAYAIALSAFAVGSAVAALAPTMTVFLLGRVLQGLGGGLITGLGFSMVRLAMPENLRSRAIGLVSAMWGVGNIVGPLLGGLFAQLDAWRAAFWLLVVLCLLLLLLAYRSLPTRDRRNPTGRIPLGSLIFLTLSVASVSAGSIVEVRWVSWSLFDIGLLALVPFVLTDRRAREGVLPQFTYARGSALKWVYIGLALLVIGSTIETYIPFFGQALGDLSPLWAGLLGAVLSWGWSLGGILSSSIERPRLKASARIVGPVVLGIGLAVYGLLQVASPTIAVIIWWYVVLFLAGLGIGIAFVHNVTAAMSSTDDPEEAMQASAGANSVQLISTAFGAAVTGFAVNFSISSGDAFASRTLAFVMASIVLLGAVLTASTIRRGRSATMSGLISESTSAASESTS
ncbi:MFS transporter [Microbacterium sp. NPDC056052]|uniref:MFS transporter n=1 Tax=Microbacterium sp. NPDC056052 TaxID=3345695 RepID=UPI0035DFDD8B